MGVETIAYLEAIVGADLTSFRRGMAEVRAELTETSGLGASLQGLGTTLTLGLTVPLVAIGVASLKLFTDFDAGMRNINSIMQLPEEQLKKLSDQVLTFGTNTRNGATAAATALYTIVSAGFGVKDTAEAMQLLAVASKTAEAGLADEETVAQLLAQSLLAYGQGSKSAAHFADVLTQTVNLGVGSMDDVAHSMGQAINISALAGVSWDELGGSAAFLTQRGMSFANAFTSINQIVSQLIKPTDGLTAAFKQLGVENGSALIAKYHGLGGALEALGTVSGTSADELAGLFTNVRALRGVASILGNFDQYGTLMQDFGSNLSGVTDRAQQQQLLSFASRLDYLKSAVTGFLTTIGEHLAPLLGDFTNFLQGVFKQLNALDPVILQNAIKVGLLVAAIGPLVFLIGLLLSPIGLITLALTALAVAWSDNFLGIRDTVGKTWTKISDFVTGIVAAFNNDIPNAVKYLVTAGLGSDTINHLIDFFKDLGDRVRFFADSFGANLANTVFYAQYYFAQIVSAGQSIVDWFTDENTGLHGAIKSVQTWLEQEIAAPFRGLWIVLQPALQPLINFFGGDASAGSNSLSGVIHLVGVTLQDLQNAFLNFWTPIQHALQPLIDWFNQAMTDVIQPFINLINTALDNWEMLRRIGGGKPERLLPGELSPGVPGNPNQLVPSTGNHSKSNWELLLQQHLNPNDVSGMGGFTSNIPLPPVGIYDHIPLTGHGTNSLFPSNAIDGLNSSPMLGVGSHNTKGGTTNHIQIITNDPDAILARLRAKGIDLEAKYSKRG